MTKKKQVGVRFDSNRTRLKTGETQRPNGTYAYRWSTPDGKRHSIYAPTLEKLREQEEQIIVDKHDGIRSDVKSITVNEMFNLWCQLKRGIKDSTFKNYIYMYGAQNGITVKSNSDSELGMRLVAYLPELHCAVDIAGATVTEKREQSVKAHICQSNRLGYYLIKRTTDTSQMAAEIKTLFIRNHIYLHTDSEKDVQVLRERFLEWKYRNAYKLNGKY